MTTISREITWAGEEGVEASHLSELEWLITNGLGGYASGTISGAITRRYHGLLIAAYPPPMGRTMVLTRINETVRDTDGVEHSLGDEDRETGEPPAPGSGNLISFRLQDGLPVWRFRVGEAVVEKRIVMVYRRNTSHIIYRLVSGPQRLRLRLGPELNFRHHDAQANTGPNELYHLLVEADHYLITRGNRPPQVRLSVPGSIFTVEEGMRTKLFYPLEHARGYDTTGLLWTPGYFSVDLAQGSDLILTTSTEDWEAVLEAPPAQALEREIERRRQLLAAADPRVRRGLTGELVLAADQFIIVPAGRRVPRQSPGSGEGLCSVIAGYHWFTDWGRDTMISLEGLALATGRHEEARRILRSFASYQRDGLIPNLFPEGDTVGLYHTADATLWFVHALWRYQELTGDRETLRHVLPQLREIVERHLSGTAFGIAMDHGDGLLRQGAKGYQLTWMDAKVGDWVVTPRRGKAVEINALWYNALRLLGKWFAEEGDEGLARRLELWAERTYASFNERFWYPEGGYLYDVVDGESGDDPSCRPNQVFAISLAYPVLEPGKWNQVLAVVRERLLTRVGLRTLAPGHPDYQEVYTGDIRARDAAYHQGTAWPWLIGPFVDAWLRCYPEQREAAHRFLEGLCGEMSWQCVGTIGEIYDAEEPHVARGCVAQAWSVAELLRCLLKTG